MKAVRIAVVVIGILMPYLARIPGAMLYGPEWLTSYFSGLSGLLFFGAFNAIAWGSILLASLTYRSPHAIWFPAVLGFGFLAYVHGNYDLASDAQAAIALIFFPIYALPFILVGWLMGLCFDLIRRRQGYVPTAEI